LLKVSSFKGMINFRSIWELKGILSYLTLALELMQDLYTFSSLVLKVPGVSVCAEITDEASMDSS
jgi:hypothetical protein